ncbi:hypothetical protein CkaCkLH20_05717 [Colletotrichum karsti]|uniref:CENP-V/GFA domain-containing protein n=1 Tax=Colletotrichum karsti TaxID=1095194 RepID=A0A9P6LL51_9PEZI|nr:uncharacterized protein CkaCkLH20_05717 [Colletotrichum karsti]KAF9876871.1 hypothetical protein CkaCkLH20_05717 [Colletotrichum karsti]
MGSNSYDEDWKKAAPYLPPSSSAPDGKPFDKLLRGACHCGQVSYWLRKDRPLASKFCHCRDCQKMHGAPFQWAAIFHKEDIAFERGVDGLEFYKSSDKKAVHDLPCKVSCGHCGSRIMDEGRNMVLLFPGLLHFEEREKRKNFNVQMHIFYKQRVVDLPDGKPKWAELDEKSDLMEEEMEQEVDEVKEEHKHDRKRSKHD